MSDHFIALNAKLSHPLVVTDVVTGHEVDSEYDAATEQLSVFKKPIYEELNTSAIGPAGGLGVDLDRGWKFCASDDSYGYIGYRLGIGMFATSADLYGISGKFGLSTGQRLAVDDGPDIGFEFGGGFEYLRMKTPMNSETIGHFSAEGAIYIYLKDDIAVGPGFKYSGGPGVGKINKLDVFEPFMMLHWDR